MSSSDDKAVSLLRAWKLGDWASRLKEHGVVGAWGEPCAELPRGTKARRLSTTEGRNRFPSWRDSGYGETLVPGTEHTRPDLSRPRRGRGAAALAAHAGENAGMAPVVALVLDHLGVTRDDTALASAPAPDSEASPGPPTPRASQPFRPPASPV
ncbi:hypothetical protein [Streptomyces sp. NRRL B-1347]|uniref:hypothetical protein n=1 Tax=Streptomyces sp. NRRL B-1347 TaxID=1476877 RepID=UPI00068D959A|nr:hypothetical protein [Streptomyces sp. NRRL B-1347]